MKFKRGLTVAPAKTKKIAQHVCVSSTRVEGTRRTQVAAFWGHLDAHRSPFRGGGAPRRVPARSDPRKEKPTWHGQMRGTQGDPAHTS